MNLSRKARREILLILFGCCLLSSAYLLIFGLGGFVLLNQVRDELEKLEIENQELHKMNTQSAWELEKLKKDPKKLERVLREKLDYARPGDVIITLPE